MKWALVLSGGGAKGIAYIGMLRAFEELQFPKPNLIVGCSMGAIVGGLYASGTLVPELENFMGKDFDVTKYIAGGKMINLNGLNKLLQIRTVLKNLFSSPGLDDGEEALMLFSRLSNYHSFEHLDIPFACNALDLHTGEEVIIESGTLASAFRATSSYPAFFAPFVNGEHLYIDGSMAHNTPVWIARKKGFKNILAVTLSDFKNSENHDDYKNTLSVVMRTLDCIFAKHELREKDYPSAWLKLQNNRASFDFTAIHRQVEFGYEETIKQKDYLSKFFETGLKGVLNRKLLEIETKKIYRL
ncbi:MAG: hypothetical protein CR988_00635 [Treponema sp.]|nr:MAG: hypothetical protein CR988_00635 [Treponema sp.]